MATSCARILPGGAEIPLPADPAGARLGPLTDAWSIPSPDDSDLEVLDAWRRAPYGRVQVWTRNQAIRICIYSRAQPVRTARAKVLDVAGEATFCVPRGSTIGFATIWAGAGTTHRVDVGVTPSDLAVPWRGQVSEEGTIAGGAAAVVALPPQGSLAAWLQATGALTVNYVVGAALYLAGNIGPAVNGGNPIPFGAQPSSRVLRLNNGGAGPVNYCAAFDVEA